MKKTTITLLFIGLFASLLLLSGTLASPVAASPAGVTITPTISEVYPAIPTKVIVINPGGGGSPILPETGELPPDSSGLGRWVYPGLAVLLVVGLIGLAAGFLTGEKLRK